MNAILIIIGIAVGIFIVAAFFGTSEAKNAGKRVAQMLSQIDKKYEDLVEKEIAGTVLNDESLDIKVDKIMSNVTVYLKPDVHALIDFISSTNYSTVNVRYQSKYFTNLVSLSEKMFGISKRTKGLTHENEEEFFEAIQDAIKSDLLKRSIDLRIR